MASTDDLRELYDAAYSRLVLQALAMGGDLPEAEAAVRAAFVHAVQHRRDVGRTGSPEAWLRAVALDHVAHPRRHGKLARREGVLGRTGTSEVQLDPAHVALVDALAELPAGQRRAVVLHHLADLGTADAAAELGVPETTVVARLTHAMARSRRSSAGPRTLVTDDLDRLREVVTRLPPPPYEEVVASARGRQRQAVVRTVMACAVGALMVASVVLDAQVRADRRSSELVGPSPQEIRADPDAVVGFAVDGPTPGVAARQLVVCTAHCDEWRSLPERWEHLDDPRYDYVSALEVSSDGFASSVLLPDPQPVQQVEVFGFSDDAFVIARFEEFTGPEFELLNVNGSTEALTMHEPRPYERGVPLVAMAPVDPGLLAVDTERGAITPVELEGRLVVEGRAVGLFNVDWAPFPRWPWGVLVHPAGDGGADEFHAVWADEDGRLGQRLLAFGHVSVAPVEVQTPGVMAFVESVDFAGDDPVAVQLSTDYGRTWDRIELTSGRTLDDVLTPYR